MRFKRLGLLLVLFAAVGIFGASPVAEPPPAQPVGPTAEAVVEGTGVRFTLHGYTGTDMPELKVTDVEGNDWSTKVDKPEPTADGVTAKLPGERGTARLAVEQMEYAWSLPGGGTVPGSIQFRDWRFKDMDWQITRTDQLIVYHVTPLRKDDLQSWTDLLTRAGEWTGQPRTERLTIWVFPDSATLNEWSRSNFAVAGLWYGDIQRLVVYDKPNSVDRQVVLLHEMVHACTPGSGPAWFEEGIAELLGVREERLLAGAKAPRWQYRLDALSELQGVAQTRRLIPLEARDQDSQPPVDPYTIGVSVWLFVRHYHGTAGLERFVAEGGGNNGIQNSLEALFGKSQQEIWDDWNAYLKSPALLKDWLAPWT